MLKGSKANIVECIKGCDHQCATCSNEPDSCDSCSENTTRDSTNSCLCKDKFYNVGTNALCSSCSSPCLNCNTSDTTCTSCNNGLYLSGNTCLVCDNTVCATCNTNDTTCDLTCNSVCKTCLVN